MSLLWNYLQKYKLSILVSLALASVNQVFSLLDPWIFRKIIDDYATKPEVYNNQQFVQGVGILLLAAVGVAFVSRVAKNFQDYFVNRITQKVGTEMYTDGIAETMKLPYVEFEDDQSGSTLSKIQKVKTDSEKLIGLLINTLFVNIVGFVFIFIYAFNIYWLIAVLYIAAFPIIGGVSFLLSKKIKKVQKNINLESNSLAGNTTETLRNIELVKSLGLGDIEIERLKSFSSGILKLELKKVKYLRSLSFIQGTIVNLVRTVLLGAMLYFIFIGRISFGEFFSLWIYSFFLFAPLQEIGNVITSWREAEASLENFKDIKKKPKEPVPQNPIQLVDIKTIELDNVVFKHKNSEVNSIENVSFVANLGQTIAFVGPTGSGKSTILKLLLGLYNADSGYVKYNNYSILEYNKDDLRKNIGIVNQDTQLFSGTLYENIAFANKDATKDEVVNVLKEAAGESILERNSLGIDAKIGENGIKLSGGEKQRIAIARALIRNPQILIFDEATSALDSITEESINHTIRSLDKKSKITFIVAHRLSTVMHADVIYVLRSGRIIESGSHEDLLSKNGLYNALWKEQTGN